MMVWNLDIIGAIFLFIVCAIITCILLRGKGGSLIAGYNMLSPEKKAKIDTPKFCRFMGKIMFMITCADVLVFVYLLTEIDILMTTSCFIIAAACIVALVWGNVHYMSPLRK